MSEKDIERQRKIVTEIIKNQLKILKLNGKAQQEVTLSIPKVTHINKSEVVNILEDILGYKPEISCYQEIKISKTSTMLFIIKLKA